MGGGQGRGWLLALLAAGAMMQAQADEMTPAERLMALERPLVIAHRGFSILAPENTLVAFRMGMIAGADMVELDYHVTADGIPLVIHDTTLDRTTDAVARWGEEGVAVSQKTARALQALDAGTWFDGSGAFAGERLPLLAEALETIQGGGGVTLAERKAGSVENCVEWLVGGQLVNQLVVQAFDWEFIAGVNRLVPGQVLGALGPPRTRNGNKLTREERFLTPAWIDEAATTGARVIGWNNQFVTAEAVRYAHERGLKVWVYTVNEAAAANALLDIGVDGIISDNTSLIWRVLAER